MDSDFLIIGGGIAGISAAATLSGLGSVRLLEAGSQPCPPCLGPLGGDV